jgi:hypothetical protein
VTAHTAAAVINAVNGKVTAPNALSTQRRPNSIPTNWNPVIDKKENSTGAVDQKYIVRIHSLFSYTTERRTDGQSIDFCILGIFESFLINLLYSLLKTQIFKTVNL